MASVGRSPAAAPRGAPPRLRLERLRGRRQMVQTQAQSPGRDRRSAPSRRARFAPPPQQDTPCSCLAWRRGRRPVRALNRALWAGAVSSVIDRPASASEVTGAWMKTNSNCGSATRSREDASPGVEPAGRSHIAVERCHLSRAGWASAPARLTEQPRRTSWMEPMYLQEGSERKRPQSFWGGHAHRLQPCLECICVQPPKKGVKREQTAEQCVLHGRDSGCRHLQAERCKIAESPPHAPRDGAAPDGDGVLSKRHRAPLQWVGHAHAVLRDVQRQLARVGGGLPFIRGNERQDVRLAQKRCISQLLLDEHL
eukprot:scaffold288_cov108-Isochrysis_galbana.AAC.7